MTQILDTIPTFDAFAGKAFLKSPYAREQLWEQLYEGAHRDVFDAFYAAEPGTEGRNALVLDLSKLRVVVNEAAPVMTQLIGEVEPAVAEALGMTGAPRPGHVLLVGPMSASAVVGRLDGRVTLFHCLEWFNSAEGARVLIAHEDAHAFHQMQLGKDNPTDVAWTAFYEGLASHVSRVAVPGRPDDDYFWYGHEGFADWLPWCRDHLDVLEERLRAALDDPKATEAFFGSGFVEGRWRVGYFLADSLVTRLDRPLAELANMNPEEGRSAIREVLG